MVCELEGVLCECNGFFCMPCRRAAFIMNVGRLVRTVSTMMLNCIVKNCIVQCANPRLPNA